MNIFWKSHAHTSWWIHVWFVGIDRHTYTTQIIMKMSRAADLWHNLHILAAGRARVACCDRSFGLSSRCRMLVILKYRERFIRWMNSTLIKYMLMIERYSYYLRLLTVILCRRNGRIAIGLTRCRRRRWWCRLGFVKHFMLKYDQRRREFA